MDVVALASWLGFRDCLLVAASVWEAPDWTGSVLLQKSGELLECANDRSGSSLVGVVIILIHRSMHP